MSLINTVEHALAKAAQDIVTAAKFVAQTVVPVLQKAKTDEATIEAVTGLVSPAAVNIERAAFALLGVVIKALGDGSQAVLAGGLNVQLDAALVADIKAIMAVVQGQAVSSGATAAAGAPKVT